MEELLLTEQIKLVKELNSMSALEKILIKMYPLIKKYTKKLYFIDKEDAAQELNLSLIESIYHIKKYENEAMCLTYLQRSVINKYYFLCKLNIKSAQMIDVSEEITDNIPYNQDFNTIELFIDIQKLLNDKNYKKNVLQDI